MTPNNLAERLPHRARREASNSNTRGASSPMPLIGPHEDNFPAIFRHGPVETTFQMPLRYNGRTITPVYMEIDKICVDIATAVASDLRIEVDNSMIATLAATVRKRIMPVFSELGRMTGSVILDKDITPRLLYKNRGSDSTGKTAIDFLNAVWGDLVEERALYQDQLKSLDPALLQAVKNYCSYTGESIHQYLPPKSRRNDLKLLAIGSIPSLERLGLAQRYRERGR